MAFRIQSDITVRCVCLLQPSLWNHDPLLEPVKRKGHRTLQCNANQKDNMVRSNRYLECNLQKKQNNSDETPLAAGLDIVHKTLKILVWSMEPRLVLVTAEGVLVIVNLQHKTTTSAPGMKLQFPVNCCTATISKIKVKTSHIHSKCSVESIVCPLIEVPPNIQSIWKVMNLKSPKQKK